MIEDWARGLAATKVRPPEPPRRLVRRSRLDTILDTGVDGPAPLLLVSAPAGSGKSTLLASWLTGRSESVAWLQVEERDSDPARFWSYLVAAIGRVHSSVADDLQPAVAGSSGDAQVVVPALVNRLTELATPLVLVVDDYHLIDSAGVHSGMERLLELCPASVTIVIGTRVDPPFRLGRLRVRGRVVEVRAGDLRFEADEAAGLLGATGEALDPALLDELCSRTEGWAAGIVLAGLSLDRSADAGAFVAGFRGDDHLVVEYLRDELLASVDPDERRRLLQTSILEELTGGLVDAVTGSTDGADWLRRTAKTNQLLIALDRTGTWFRYHHLLRDLLRLEAEESMPDQLPGLHQRAAEWFESHQDHGNALAHRLAAGDSSAAARLMRIHGPQLLRRGQVETLRGLLTQLGDEAASDPGCALLAGWASYITGRYSLAREWLDTALDVAPPGFDRVLTTGLRINICLATGDVATALDVARSVTAEDLTTRPADLATATGAAHGWAGRPDEARAALEGAVERADADANRSAQVLALVYLAIVELEHGSMAGARTAAATAVDTARAFGLTDYHGVAPAQAVRARAGDDPDQARADATHALASARRASTPLAFGYVLAVCGDTLLELGDPAGEELLAEARSILGRCPDPGIAGRYLDRAESRHRTAEHPARVDTLFEQLTEREMAVLRHLPTSMSQREIASELYVSLNTVKTHCRAIYRKLAVADRKAAVQAARDRQLL